MKFRSPKTPQAPQQSFAFVAARAEALQRASPELRSIIVGEMCLPEGKVVAARIADHIAHFACFSGVSRLVATAEENRLSFRRTSGLDAHFSARRRSAPRTAQRCHQSAERSDD